MPGILANDQTFDQAMERLNLLLTGVRRADLALIAINMIKMPFTRTFHVPPFELNGIELAVAV